VSWHTTALKRGKHQVTATVYDSSGRSYTDTRTFRACR
jgi:hypothetical protein